MGSDAFVYVVVIPISVVFAFRRVVFGKLWKDIAFWAIPVLVGNLTLYPADMPKLQVAASLIASGALFAAVVWAAARIYDWLTAEQQ